MARLRAEGLDLPPAGGRPSPLSCVELCAGGGGQAIGLERAGFESEALVELEPNSCETLRRNRPRWNVVEGDVRGFDARPWRGADLVSGGVPCPPFSIAGKKLGGGDDRDLFPEAVRVVREVRPRAVMLENVRGILHSVFDDYRERLRRSLVRLGYVAEWRLLQASDFGVSQLRPRAVMVAVRRDISDRFAWPEPRRRRPPTVGALLHGQMSERGWRRADDWRLLASSIAPTIVGGSERHGGPDLGPTRARRQWARLGVDGLGIANEAPDPGFVGMPRLTTPMVARLQGFPASWRFSGSKTRAYRQVGNAFPPPVACAVAKRIRACLAA